MGGELRVARRGSAGVARHAVTRTGAALPSCVGIPVATRQVIVGTPLPPFDMLASWKSVPLFQGAS